MSYGVNDQTVKVSVVMKSGKRHDGKVPEYLVDSLARAVRAGDDSDAGVGRIRTPDGELSFRPSSVETLLTAVRNGT